MSRPPLRNVTHHVVASSICGRPLHHTNLTRRNISPHLEQLSSPFEASSQCTSRPAACAPHLPAPPPLNRHHHLSTAITDANNNTHPLSESLHHTSYPPHPATHITPMLRRTLLSVPEIISRISSKPWLTTCNCTRVYDYVLA